MPITLPSYVAPNELIQSAWGNAVVNALNELDVEKVDLAGDAMTGTLSIAGTDGQLRIRPTNDLPLVDFFDGDAVTRFGIVDATLARMRVLGEGDVVLQAGANEMLRGTGTTTLFGKTASNLASSGVEVVSSGSSVGSIRSSISAASIQNAYFRHNSSADADTEAFTQFNRSGTQIGSITQVSTTGVAYNTTSDERLKTVLRDLDDAETAEILRVIAPVVYEFKDDPGVEHVGFIAQDLVRAWPEFKDVGVVTPGRGEPEDEDFVPWMVDLARMVPLIVAGWQALDRRLAALGSS